MINNTLSIIMADTESEVERLISLLELEAVHSIKDLATAILEEPDPVFWVVIPNEQSMQQLVSVLKVRRGIMSIQGKINYVGFNKDWMVKTLTANKPVKPSVPSRSVTISTQMEWVKDDPYTDLGYTR